LQLSDMYEITKFAMANPGLLKMAMASKELTLEIYGVVVCIEQGE
jgi:hypothetical protein